MPATPKKGRRFGGSSQHQRLMMANLVASLVAAEGIVTTEAKAKALRPVPEKVITKAKKGGLHNHRQVVSYLGDKEMAHRLFEEIGPRYADRNGGYTRILKLGPRSGDNARRALLECAAAHQPLWLADCRSDTLRRGPECWSRAGQARRGVRRHRLQRFRGAAGTARRANRGRCARPRDRQGPAARGEARVRGPHRRGCPRVG